MVYHLARTIDDAVAAIDAGAEVIAGGTDWFPARGERIGDVSLIDISMLGGMTDIVLQDGYWRIGAAVTWSDVLRAELPPAFDALCGAAREVGSVQIQNVGTLVGNLCNASPAADGVPPLLCLGALVEVVSARGVRRVPLADFILGPRRTDMKTGEFVQAIVVPEPAAGAVSVWHKAGSRAYLVISIAMISVQVVVVNNKFADVRIAVGACGPVACRLTGLEARLGGRGVVPKIGVADLAELAPIDDVRGEASYRLDIVAAILERMLRGLL